MGSVEIVLERELNEHQKKALMLLWNAEYPVNIALDGMTGLESYLQRMNEPLHFFGSVDGKIVAWAALFNRDNQRWFGIIVGCNVQKTGLGSLLLNKLKQHTNELYGWATDHEMYTKTDGTVYPSPVGFYTKHGFEILPGRLETDQLSAVKIKWTR